MLSKIKMKKMVVLLAVTIVAAIAIFYYLNSKIKITETLVGIGPEVVIGKTAVFDYRAFLYDSHAPKGLGVEFDSSYRRNTQMRALLGAQQVIPGLEQALQGMKAGGHREVLIPAKLAYGKAGAGDGLVPPNASVVYLIELRSIE